MKNRWIFGVYVTVISALLTGCVPYADQPLTDPGKSLIAASPRGTWYWNEASEHGFVHIGTNEAGDRLRLLMVTLYTRDGELEIAEFSGHPSVIGGNTYLNLKAVGTVPGAPDGFFFMKIIPDENSLGFAFMDGHVVEKAIGDGTLKGTVGKPGDSMAIHITDTPARLRDFLVKNEKALYGQVKFLPRLVLPTRMRFFGRSSEVPFEAPANLFVVVPVGLKI